jgi:hypothetical protein
MRPEIFIPAVVCFLVAVAASLFVASRFGLRWAIAVLAAGTIFGLLFPWELLTG